MAASRSTGSLCSCTRTQQRLNFALSPELSLSPPPPARQQAEVVCTQSHLAALFRSLDEGGEEGVMAKGWQPGRRVRQRPNQLCQKVHCSRLQLNQGEGEKGQEREEEEGGGGGGGGGEGVSMGRQEASARSLTLSALLASLWEWQSCSTVATQGTTPSKYLGSTCSEGEGINRTVTLSTSIRHTRQ